MRKWPKPYTEEKPPPEEIYLGWDVSSSTVQVTWWIWPTIRDDVKYVRSDLIEKYKNGTSS